MVRSITNSMVIIALLCGIGLSQIPQTLSYQGVLKEASGSTVPNGNYNLTFRIYSAASGGTALWTEAQSVAVTDGIFNVVLGSMVVLNLPFDVPYWLGITIGIGSELTPRIQLTSSAYSLNSHSVENNAITTAKIADEAVTQAKLAPGLSLPPGGTAGGDLSGTYPNPQIAENAVTSAKIQDGTIQTIDLAFNPLTRPLNPGVAGDEIADNAVTTAKIADGAVTQAKLDPGLSLPPGGTAGGDLTGTYPNPTIAAGAVNTSKLADNAVSSAKITDGTVATIDLADNAVTSAKISDGTVAAADLATNAVTTVKVNDLAVTTAKIADGAVTQIKLDPGLSVPPGGAAGGDLTGTYPNPTIANSAVTSAKIADGAVAAADLATNAVTTVKIQDAAVTQAKIAAGVTLPPSGTAGGDLSGSYPNPTVDGLQGRSVAATAPTSGQALKWSGTAWAPAVDNVGVSYWTASGSNIYNNNTGRVGIGTTTPRSRLNVSTSGTYAGFFTSDSNHQNTHVLQAEYTGTGNFNASAIYGRSVPVNGYGIGGIFEAGAAGVIGIGTGGASTGACYGLAGQASGTDGHRYGVYGYASNSFINTAYTFGVYGYATGYRAYGIYGYVGSGEIRYAGYFDGNVSVTGYVSKAGGSFKIDHPLDPENKYLYHSFVESPDMKNIYDGVAALDGNGEAWVELPEWFGALNSDFRYQLTCIGGYAPVYIRRKIADNRFQIAGGIPGLEVSWQVTGIRQDAWAQKNRIPVEERKRADERGLYLHPEAFGQPESRGMNYQLRKAAEEKRPVIE